MVSRTGGRASTTSYPPSICLWAIIRRPSTSTFSQKVVAAAEAGAQRRIGDIGGVWVGDGAEASAGEGIRVAVEGRAAGQRGPGQPGGAGNDGGPDVAGAGGGGRSEG